MLLFSPSRSIVPKSHLDKSSVPNHLDNSRKEAHRASSSGRRISLKGGYSLNGFSRLHPYIPCLERSREDNCNLQSLSENHPEPEADWLNEWD
ncbi:hypothetical protein TNCV_624991 [Trichonephila clavipes]|nr:hypothetical protein TNCV_624991 [Trichonephila clavipes]